MNDPNKAINVNISSLLSLKAELLRKQAEVNKAKATRTASEEYTKNPAASKKANSRINEPKEVSKKSDGSKVYEHEDSALLEKSKRVLEAKSKFYERMTQIGGTLNSDDNCLVLFNRKQQDEKPEMNYEIPMEFKNTKEASSSESDNEADDKYHDENDEENWVEYTDCLGRTRKCLRKDLESAKKRDAELSASMPERIDQSKPLWFIDNKKSQKVANEDSDNSNDDTPIGPPAPTESIYSDGCSLMSKHDEQRLNWEKKEQENLDKTQVHYQDVFFDEARQHGVGYYAFSTDEAERKRQQEELENTRLKTIDEQKRRDALRAQREKIIAERVLAAKNRQRARLGLPPLTAEEFENEKRAAEPAVNESKEERKARKRAEKQKLKQETEEAERQKLREVHIRPWDKEKDGVKVSNGPSSSTAGFVAGEPEWTYKPEREPLSQEEWNERKRAERNPDFAPVDEPEVKLKRTNFSRHDDIMPPPPPPPPFITQSSHVEENTFVNFQTSKSERKFLRKNYDPSKDDVIDDRAGAAIPPPSNLDAQYTLPPHQKKHKKNDDLERSIEAGLRFLRNNSDKGNMSTKSSWTAKADYE